MLERLVGWSIRNRILVVLATVIVAVIGVQALWRAPLDAIPDLSDVQVIVFTEYAGQAPRIVEDQVTYPLATQLLAVPYARTVRAYSFFGFSFVYVIFEDGTDLYWARSRVLETLSNVARTLPPGVTPALGPDATGVGWAFMYALQSDRHDLAELRSIQDWFLKYALTSVPGVAEVASVGGFVRQYQITVDPEPAARLRHAHLQDSHRRPGQQQRCRRASAGGGREGVHDPRPRLYRLGWTTSARSRSASMPPARRSCCGTWRPSASGRRCAGASASGTARARPWAASSSCATARAPCKVIEDVKAKLAEVKAPRLPEGVTIEVGL